MGEVPPFQGLNPGVPLSQGFALGYTIPPLWGYEKTHVEGPHSAEVLRRLDTWMIG
jgi:hypothetical protein